MELVSCVRPRKLYSFEAHHVISSRPIENCISVLSITMLYVHVVVKTYNLVILRCFIEYGKEIQ